jgi:hypothetical protein
MRAFVLRDEALTRHAGRFVWLAIDIENAVNAPFLVKFPVGGLPTLMVIDPKTEAIALRYQGSATVSQLTRLFDDGAGIVRRARNSADDAITRADRATAVKEAAEAAKAYEQAIAGAPKGWPRFGRAAEMLIASLRDSRDSERCASRAVDLYSPLAGTASGAIVATRGLSCALRLVDAQKGRPDLVEPLKKAVHDELQKPHPDLFDGDRADMYFALIGERRRAHDEAGTRALRDEVAATLEKQAAAAPTPEKRAAYDFYRLHVYFDLGQPERAISMLEQSERDFPNDYLPPEQLASAFQKMHRYDEALAASDRALARVYGPQKAEILFRRAEIYEAKGDKSAAQQLLREAIAFCEALPPGQRDDGIIAMIKRRLEKM